MITVHVPLELLTDPALEPMQRYLYTVLLRVAAEQEHMASHLAPPDQPEHAGSVARVARESTRETVRESAAGSAPEDAPPVVRLSITEICLLSGLADRATVIRHLHALAEAGWIAVTGRRPHIYALHNPLREQLQNDAQQAVLRIQKSDWKGEAILRELLNLFVEDRDFIDNARPNFLQISSGGTLEYDRYYYKARVAFEFNGPQHYGSTERFPQFEQQQARDGIKIRRSVENGVHLIEVTRDDLEPERLLARIDHRLPLRRVPPDHPVLVAIMNELHRYWRLRRA